MEAARDPRRVGNLVAAIATIAACDISLGLTFSLLPLILEARGTPAWLIGLNAAMGPLGILVTGPFIAGIVVRFGSKPVVTAAIAAICACLFAFYMFPGLPAWFVIRFVFGMAAGTLFTVSEAWILTFAEEGSRGRIMGAYTSVLSVSFALGPLMLPHTGIEGSLPWAVGAACVALSVLPLTFISVSEDTFREHREHGVLGFMARAPLLLVAVGAVTVCDAVILSFFQIWGLRHGLDMTVTGTVLGLAIIGNAFLQYPIGMLADRWSRLGVIVASSAVTTVLSLALIWTVSGWLLWPVTILLGTAAFANYTVTLAILGDSFKGGDLVAGSAAFAMVWGIGGIAGPALTGAAADYFGIDAIPVALAVPYVLLLALLAFTGGRLVRGT